MASKALTPQQRLYCQHRLAGLTQAESYKRAYGKDHWQRASLDVKGSNLEKLPQVAAHLNALRKAVEERAIRKAVFSKEQYERWLETRMLVDPGRMYDEHGNPVEPPKLEESERLMLAGWDQEESFTKVRKSGGEEDAIPTGYTRKIRLRDPLPYGQELAKVRGWYPEKGDGMPSHDDLRGLSLTVRVVNAKGEIVEPKILNAVPNAGESPPAQSLPKLTVNVVPSKQS